MDKRYDYATYIPKNYFPLTHKVRAWFRSINWWAALGITICFISLATMAIILTFAVTAAIR